MKKVFAIVILSALFVFAFGGDKTRQDGQQAKKPSPALAKPAASGVRLTKPMPTELQDFIDAALPIVVKNIKTAETIGTRFFFVASDPKREFADSVLQRIRDEYKRNAAPKISIVNKMEDAEVCVAVDFFDTDTEYVLQYVTQNLTVPTKDSTVFNYHLQKSALKDDGTVVDLGKMDKIMMEYNKDKFKKELDKEYEKKTALGGGKPSLEGTWIDEDGFKLIIGGGFFNDDGELTYYTVKGDTIIQKFHYDGLEARYIYSISGNNLTMTELGTDDAIVLTREERPQTEKQLVVGPVNLNADTLKTNFARTAEFFHRKDGRGGRKLVVFIDTFKNKRSAKHTDVITILSSMRAAFADDKKFTIVDNMDAADFAVTGTVDLLVQKTDGQITRNYVVTTEIINLKSKAITVRRVNLIKK